MTLVVASTSNPLGSGTNPALIVTRGGSNNRVCQLPCALNSPYLWHSRVAVKCVCVLGSASMLKLFIEHFVLCCFFKPLIFFLLSLIKDLVLSARVFYPFHPYLLVQMKAVSNLAKLSHAILGRILHPLLPLYLHPEGRT